MDDKKRRQDPQSDRNQQGNEPSDQNPRQDVSNQEDQNPQKGGSWNNYRTREMSGGSEQGENFYQNRERGNYEPGRASEEGGGSLY